MPCLKSSRSLAKLALSSPQSVLLYNKPAIHLCHADMYRNDYQCFQQDKIQSTKTCCLHQAASHQEYNLADYKKLAMWLTISIDINLSLQQWQFKFLSIMQDCNPIGVLPKRRHIPWTIKWIWSAVCKWNLLYQNHRYLVTPAFLVSTRVPETNL